MKRGKNPRLCDCTWYADVYLEGKRVYIRLDGDYDSARARYARIVADQLEGRIVERRARAERRGATSFGAVAQRWLKQKEVEGIRPTTLRAVTAHANRLTDWFGDQPVEDITREEVMDLMNVIRDNQSPGYARQIWSSLRMILIYAEELGIIESAPLPKRRMVFAAGEDKGTIDLNEIEAVIARIPEDIRDLAEFVYLTGLRIGEALALTPEDVQGHFINVNKTLSQEGVAGPPKTRRSVRKVALSPRAKEIADDRAAKGGPRLWNQSYYVIQRSLKNTYPKGTPRAQRITWHTFRHANVTLRAKAAQDLRTQQNQLGHGSLQRTLSYGLDAEHVPSDVDALDAARANEDG